MKILVKAIIKGYKKFESYNNLRRIKNSIANGLKIGKNVTIMNNVSFDGQYPYMISIGDNCAISRDVRILAHDATVHKFIGITRIARVDIKDNVFIGERSVILPGVTIGPNVMVAAGSVVNKDIAPNSCVAGVPARVYRKFDEMIQYHKDNSKNRFSIKRSIAMAPISSEIKNDILKEAEKGEVYITDYDLPVIQT